MTAFQLGSISTGTLRTEDLLDTFGTLLEHWGKPIADEYGTPEERLSVMMDVLTEYSPPFVYFGAHPGDGSDFGFWKFENE